MAITGKQSPLGAGVNGSLLQNIGLCLNPTTVGYVGKCQVHNYNDGNDIYSPGSVVNNTCLLWLTYGINKGYIRVKAGEISTGTYADLIAIGSDKIPALGNAKAPTFTWYGPAHNGTPSSLLEQSISWYPYQATNTTNVYPTSNPTALQYSNLTQSPYYRSITQWGWIRLFALQAWNEFNWNNYNPNSPLDYPPSFTVYYKEFLSSFNTIAGFINYANVSINAQADGPSFLKNTYSNIDDLISADVTGVSKATFSFGNDLILSGKVIDLTKIDKFGLPSVLLLTLKKFNGLTKNLTFALIASGIDTVTLNKILTNNAVPTLQQEMQIYAAFNTISGTDLSDILVTLNCGTTNLNTLADLLNPKKLFPNSYSSLTVPVYNPGPGPTNSKTYYLIYENGSTNLSLTTPQVVSRIGTLGVAPPSVNAPGLGTNFQVPPAGFTSYLSTSIPNDIAVACGAFSVAMQQIKNIKNVPIEKFAQLVTNIETTKGLPLTAGTNVPANTTLTSGGLTQTAFGSGPNGSWVMSDFLGSMSGLPYPWKDIESLITSIQTTKLKNIYQELYLALYWSGATGSVQYTTRAELVSTTPSVVYNYYYTVTGITITNSGGGYTRGTAPVPQATIVGTYSGSVPTVTAVVYTDTNDVPNYGKIKQFVTASIGEQSNGSGSSPTPPDPGFTIQIECPPIATLAVQSDGSKSTSGTNTPYTQTGWSSPMESVVQAYIAQANTEVTSIFATNSPQISLLNKNWNITGTQLTIEQHGRDIALHPVPVPKDNRLNPYPVAIHAYIDAIPSYSRKTEPHMFAQTIDAISDLSTPGGQSQVAQQRADRNTARLIEAGIPLDDNMSGTFTPITTKILMGNGTVSVGRNGVPAGDAIFTIPANQEVIGAQPKGYNTPDGYVTAPMSPSSMLGTIPNTAVPGQDGAGPGIEQVPDPINPIAGSAPSGPEEVLPTGAPVEFYPPFNKTYGSLAKSPYINLIPPQLSVPYISGIVSPSVYSVPEAIDEVIRCNCDCWLD